MDRHVLLVDAATAIADGEPVDWGRLDAALSSSPDSDTMAGLRLLERIVSFHSSLPSTGTFSTTVSSGGPLHESVLAPTTWGPLTIVERIGRGTFGDVYRARDPRLDRPVALKLLRRRDERDTDTTVVEEARLHARVRHPNVVTVYGAERIDGRIGIWMELVDGATLEDELRRRGPFPPDEVARIGIELCGALGSVHRAGLLHRDLKALNVMRDGEGRVVLADFGAGREVIADGDAPAVGGRELAGTPLYLAPEVLEGRPASEQSDIYSLGVLLHHLVTARFPVHGRSIRGLRDAHGRGLRDPLTRSGSVPRSLARAIDRATDPDPVNRYTDAASFQAALSGTLDSPGAFTRRAAAVVVIAAAVAIAGWAWRSLSSTGPREPAEASSARVPSVDARGGQEILIASFENRTGDPVLDDTIEAVLERELADSAFVHVVSRARIGDALLLMQRPADTTLDASLARDVALRDGNVRAVVQGRIERVGDAYRVGIDLLDPADGAIMTALSENAPSRAELVTAVRRQALRLREALGEMPSSILGSEAALAKVTTPSLLALQLYTQAAAFMPPGHAPWRNDLAASLLRNALEADPAFGSANILLAWALFNQRVPADNYLPYARRAAELADHTTEAERLFILASYHQLQSNASVDARPNLMRAVDLYEILLRNHPDYPWASNNLKVALLELNRQEDVADIAVQEAVIRPQSWAAQKEAAFRLFENGAAASAREYIERARLLMPFDLAAEGAARGSLDAFEIWLFEAYEAWERHDVVRAGKALDDVVRRHGRVGVPITLPPLYVGLGRLQEAGDLALPAPLRFGAPIGRAFMLHARAWLGDSRASDELDSFFELALQTPETFQVNEFTVPGLIRHGRIDAARALTELKIERLPREIRSEIEGHLAVASGRLDEGALAFRERAQTSLLPVPATSALGMAWTLSAGREAQGDLAGAIRELEAATSSPRQWRAALLGPLGGVAFWIHARDELARLYRKAGRVEEARAIDDELRALLAVADADHPVLVALKSRR